jgi:hypothetical protein
MTAAGKMQDGGSQILLGIVADRLKGFVARRME